MPLEKTPQMTDEVESETQVVTRAKILQMQRQLFVLLNQGRHEEVEVQVGQNE